MIDGDEDSRASSAAGQSAGKPRGSTHAAVERLGLAIVGREPYEPGDVISIEAVVNRLGVTRAMAREVLQSLGQKRLVDLQPRVGATVAPMDDWDVYDPEVIDWRLEIAPSFHRQSLAELREGVEPQAAALAAERGSAEVCRDLLSLSRRMQELGEREDFAADPQVRDRYREADERFHVALLRGSQNEMLLGLAHPVIKALAYRIERDFEGDAPGRLEAGSGQLSRFPKRPEPLALWLHRAVAYAVDQRRPKAAEAFSKAMLAEIRQGDPIADDDLRHGLERAVRQLDPKAMRGGDYARLTAVVGPLLLASRTRMVALGPPIVVMGVAGAGKSHVGRRLADTLGVPFAEADDLHSPANVEKMAAGDPLTDADRAPWLAAVGVRLAQSGSGLVITCSALKRSYRDTLRDAAPGTRFVQLVIDQKLAEQRISQRSNHFMPASLVDSQFAILEPLLADEAGVAVNGAHPPEQIIATVLDRLGNL